MTYTIKKQRYGALNAVQLHTQSAIAKKTRWPRTYVNQAIRHGREVPEKVAKKWARLMRVPVGDLFEEAVEAIND